MRRAQCSLTSPPARCAQGADVVISDMRDLKYLVQVGAAARGGHIPRGTFPSRAVTCNH